MNPSQKKPPEPQTGLRRIWKALFYSLDGLNHGIRNEPAVRQEFLLACVLIPLALALPTEPVLKLILVITPIGVLITELLNSAIEAVADRASPEYHPLVKQAKDMGSAAVLLSLVILVMAWLLALYRIFF